MVWTLWRREKSCLCRELKPGRRTRSLPQYRHILVHVWKEHKFQIAVQNRSSNVRTSWSWHPYYCGVFYCLNCLVIRCFVGRITGAVFASKCQLFLLGFSDFVEYLLLLPPLPITVAIQFKAWHVFARWNAGIACSNPAQDVDVCVVLWVDSGLVTGWSPIQGVLLTV
jgi:hypothetical protein